MLPFALGKMLFTGVLSAWDSALCTGTTYPTVRQAIGNAGTPGRIAITGRVLHSERSDAVYLNAAVWSAG